MIFFFRKWGELRSRLIHINLLQHLQLQQGLNLNAQLQALQDQVAANRDIDASAIALITGLVKKLEDAKFDPAAIEALTNDLKASTAGLAAAIVANTAPADPVADPVADPAVTDPAV